MTQNAPKIGALASAFWSALVLYANSFVSLPGDEAMADAVQVAGVALLIAAPAWLIGRFVQKRYTDPKVPPDLSSDDGEPHGDPEA